MPLIEKYQPTLWIHGHTHEKADYMIGNTRIVSNPRGYNRETLYGRRGCDEDSNPEVKEFDSYGLGIII